MSRIKSPIAESVRSDILCHISEIAMRLNRKVNWDPAKERFHYDYKGNLRVLPRRCGPPGVYDEPLSTRNARQR